MAKHTCYDHWERDQLSCYKHMTQHVHSSCTLYNSTGWSDLPPWTAYHYIAGDT